MIPMERPKQENRHCEYIYKYIQDPHNQPTEIIADPRMKKHEIKWNGKISELDKWCRDEHHCGGCNE